MKLTPEQKSANKEFALLRNAAYHARCKELRIELDGVDEKELEKILDAAVAYRNKLVAEQNSKIGAIRHKIALLDNQLQLLSIEYEPVILGARGEESKAYANFSIAKNNKVAEIESRFTDLDNTFGYPSQWIAPPGYIEKFLQQDKGAKK